MSRCQHSNSVHTLGDGLGNWITRCEVCLLSGDWFKTPIISQVSFTEHDLNYFNPKETEMSTSDYRRGVEDATKPILYEDIQKSTVSSLPEAASNVYNRIVERRRKELLTKKVTKWVNIYQNDAGEVQTGYRSTYESRGAAAANTKYPDMGYKYIGTYPIEIELPL